MFQVALVGCLFLPLETDIRNFRGFTGQKKKKKWWIDFYKKLDLLHPDFCLSYDFVLLDYRTFCVWKCHQRIDCNGTAFSGQVRLEEEGGS